jgi:hypothetical protein
MMYSRRVIDKWFFLLECVLKARPLKCADGSERLASASEFMFMGLRGGEAAAFKHRDTRNYIYLLSDGGLYVPEGRPWGSFHQGTFDAINPVALRALLKREGFPV